MVKRKVGGHSRGQDGKKYKVKDYVQERPDSEVKGATKVPQKAPEVAAAPSGERVSETSVGTTDKAWDNFQDVKPPKEDLLAEAAKHRKIAADAGDKERKSFDHSDTDGALSQWSYQLKQRLHLTLAEILENGKKAAFPVLVNDETGEIVPARIIDTRYGPRWAVFGSADAANAERGKIEQWVGTTDSALEKEGYRLAYQKRDAWAGYSGSGGPDFRGRARVSYRRFEVQPGRAAR